MQNPWGTPKIVTIAGFPLPQMGGLNPEEKEYMALKVRNDQFRQIEPLAEVVNLIVEKEGISQEQVIALVRRQLENTAGDTEEEQNKLMLFTINYRNELAKINQPQLTIEKQSQEIAVMILRSRLNPSFILENIDNLTKTFRCSLDRIECSKLMAIAEEHWLQDPTREKICRLIVAKLPQNLYNRLAAFALGEEREWAEVSPQPQLHEVSLGERSPALTNIEPPQNQSSNSTEMLTTSSNTLESPTQPTIEESTTVSPAG